MKLKQFASVWDGQQYAFTSIPRPMLTLLPSVVILPKERGCVDIVQSFPVAHYVNVITIIKLEEPKLPSIL
jgi:hypothetical protein